MKKVVSLTLLLLLLFTLAGCGPKDANAITKDLSSRVDKMLGYKSKAVLTLQTGKIPQEYDVEVWYQKPNLYRIALTSKQRDITQIILKNKDGVFVLTPHLNKSFRFQSEWPQKHGQVYLYESLVNSITTDTARHFQTEGDGYSFEVKADYQNRTLTSQKITLNKSLDPIKVEVRDTNMNPMVTLVYSEFQMNPAFDKDAFDKERNMQAAILDSAPAMASSVQSSSDSFGVIEPDYLPKGVTLADTTKSVDKDGIQIVQRYTGKYRFSLVENRAHATPVSFATGEPVDLGYTIGVLTGNQVKTMIWNNDNVEYKLYGDLPSDEMVQVAKSVFNQVGK
ncbi:DUF4367 domain-containing protein [Aneurinibacillus sp. Ricciae_BoGa-3]|uniref:DUF4367 domain-containing protein n=1 Tax=Aneurinibacillus sp. Ricciae_BoGa-3 TaxID=3022697 RepID=UPI0023406BCF|nr:DUF4367 domain-containing protein [Aneurinibacillus sp. Ricciae_BoGa-3]WCK54988.1 DUF4367 domain-containing protein [Aneurinibacillus sp. Ricciae_BoGa-3]